MKTLKIVLITVATLVIVGATVFFLLGYFRAKPSGIFVSTSPQSSVYINGSFAGKTPFQKTYQAETINLKLVPDITDQSLYPFETKLTLVSGIQTVVRREFGKSEADSSGDIISFEKEGGADAGLIVVSTPDNAQVSVDGVPRGFAPYKISSISPAAHQITVKADGYTDRVMTVNTQAGYRLTLFAKLAVSTEAAAAQAGSPTPTPAPRGMVLILQTPTGYLRVRSEPGTKGEEIGQVKPGEKYPFLESDPDTNWIKIQFEEPQAGLPNGISGWISNQYAKLVDSTGNPIPTPSPTPNPNSPGY